jgi:L-rhamnose isomerase/sugar isomerase
MLDQSHNVTDPIESLMTSAGETVRAYVQAHMVDRARLSEYQEKNDALMALGTLKRAFQTDVEPILAKRGRHRPGAVRKVRPLSRDPRALGRLRLEQQMPRQIEVLRYSTNSEFHHAVMPPF